MPLPESIVDLARGLTVPEVADRYRVGESKIRSWIRAGHLRAINVSDAECGRPRYVIVPEALHEFEKQRSAGPTPKAPRRKRRTLVHDYYPGD